MLQTFAGKAAAVSEAVLPFDFQPRRWHHVVAAHTPGGPLSAPLAMLYVDGKAVAAAEKLRYPKVCGQSVCDACSLELGWRWQFVVQETLFQRQGLPGMARGMSALLPACLACSWKRNAMHFESYIRDGSRYSCLLKHNGKEGCAQIQLYCQSIKVVCCDRRWRQLACFQSS